MDDDVSPNTSRGSTPCLGNGYNASARRHTPASISITELSQQLDQHTLTPRRPSTHRDTPRARELNSAPQSASSFANRVYRQRQSMSRLQCSSAHLSRISALVEDMVHTGVPTYNPTTCDPTYNDSTSPSLSPDEQQPPLNSYFGLTPLPASSTSILIKRDLGHPQRTLRSAHSFKIDKEARHTVSRDGLGGQRFVQKKVRVRKSTKQLMKGTEKRKE